MLKLVLIILGTVSLFFGIAGIFIPGLPTTPFILLTAGLYVRSSEKLYNQLIINKYVGPFISDFRKNKGMNIQTKAYSIILMWVMIFTSAYFFINSLRARLVLIGAGIIGTIVMGFIVPTVKNKHD
ncbi:MAG: YbaN family protein [Bacteroidales bacterium]|nr:MAG: YbaN family protein [Bacteroidales bacterium]